MVAVDGAQSIPVEVSESAARAFVRRHAATISLGIILVMAAALRLTGRDWDDGRYLHPDERFMTMVATGIRWPSSIGEYFDSSVSPLNPYNNEFGSFVYGTFPLFLGKFAGNMFGQNVYGDFHLAGRLLSAVFDLLTILFVYGIARRLFGTLTGLAAALLLTFTVFHIQSSHFFTADTFVTTLCTGVFFWALRTDERGRWWEYGLAGITAGLAISSKLSALPMVAVLALPAIEALRVSGWRALLRRPRAGALPPVLGVAFALICTLWTFRIAQPYAFLGPGFFDFQFDPRWTADIDYWREVQSGAIDMPPSIQWADRTPILFVLRNVVLWGLGPPLGIAALAGLGFGAIRLAVSRRWPPTWQLVLIGWPAFHIVYYGTGFVKTMRYLLPAYPFLVILAAAFLVHLWSRGVTDARLKISWRMAPLVAVVVLSAVYALAFTSIYTRTTTRVAASEWIFDNVPEGTTALSEHWDDPLPILLPNRPIDAYIGEQLELYHEDNLDKLDHMMDQLERADYIFISSNRLYLSIPRIPERYPMTIAYYDLLFSGGLGFERIKTFSSQPELLGFTLDDSGAEEAFTVYDHPTVYIYKKTEAFDPIAIEDALYSALISTDVVNLNPMFTGKNSLMMTDAERQVQQAGGTWSEIFHPADLANRHPIRAWYLALQLFALAAFPLCWRAFRRLPDRGYAVSKSLGLLFTGYVTWLLASLKIVDFGRSAVVLGVAATAVVSLCAIWSRRHEFLGDVRGRWRELLFIEALFVAAFFAFVWLRSLNPDLWHPYRGGEKPMEFAYFNAIIRSTHFPPYDPWFAGGYINYYYFGYVLLASVTRLTGVIPAVAFNLAVPTLFALFVLNTWSFARNVIGILLPRRVEGRGWLVPVLALAGPLLATGIGNLELARKLGAGEYGYADFPASGAFGLGTLGDVIRGTWRGLTDPLPLPPDAFWSETRVIPDTVNEFPYFTFLFADFHPHMIGLTFTSAVLVVALGVLHQRRWPARGETAPVEPRAGLFTSRVAIRTAIRDVASEPVRERLPLVALTALVTGALYPLNTWDYPTYVLVVVSAFALLELVSDDPEKGARWSFGFSEVRRVAAWSVGTLVLGRLMFLPYFAGYSQPNSGFDPWVAPVTTPREYLIVHGILLFFVVTYLIADIAAAGPRWMVPVVRPRTWRAAPADHSGSGTLTVTYQRGGLAVNAPGMIVALVSAGLIVMLLVSQLLIGIAVLLVLVATAMWVRRREPLRLWIAGLAGIALVLSAAVERYALKGDIGRFNTVFKFYMQIWLLLAMAGAVGIAILILQHHRLVTPVGRLTWAIVAAVLLLAGLMYPVMATPARLDDRFNPLPRSLNGTDYMLSAVYSEVPRDGGREYSYTLRYDLDGINWLLATVEGSPVVLEANTPLYRWGSRISVYTGLPTVLGWDWHQTQQRAGYGDLINKRRSDVQTMFTRGLGFDEVRPLIEKYHVKYVYIGELEHAYYGKSVNRIYDEAVVRGLMRVAYTNPGVTIYEYIGDPAAPAD